MGRAIRANEAAIKTARGRFEFRVTVFNAKQRSALFREESENGDPADHLSPIPPEVDGDTFTYTKQMKWGLDGRKERVDVVIPYFNGAGEEIAYEERLATDGSTATSYNPHWSSARTGLAPKAVPNEFLDPMDFGLRCLRGGLPEVLTSADRQVVVRGLEPIQGITCWRVDISEGGSLRTSCWLDPARGYLPRRVERYGGHGRPTARIEVSRFKRSPTGGWFPVQGARQLIVYDSEQRKLYPMERTEYCAVELSLNEPIDEAWFRLHLPPETYVYNEQTKSTFVVGQPAPEVNDADMSILLAEDRTLDLATAEPASETPVQQTGASPDPANGRPEALKEQNPGGPLKPALVVLGGCVLAGLLAVVYIGYKKKRG